ATSTSICLSHALALLGTHSLSLHDALPISGRPAGMGDTNKRRLLEAAREQFSSQGFRSVTMRSIAAEAGVDVALIDRIVTLRNRSEEHTSELQSRFDLVCRLLLEKKKIHTN